MSKVKDKKQPENGNSRLQVTVPTELAERIRKVAKDNGLTVSAICRKMITDAINSGYQVSLFGDS